MKGKKLLDYLIIGAGPGGLQLGYYLGKAGRDYLILERGESPGMFFKKFPRHRALLSINKVYTGYNDPEVRLRWDWNSLLNDTYELPFTDYTKDYFPDADTLCRYLRDFAKKFKIRIRFGSAVTKVSRTKDSFEIEDSKGITYRSKRLIVATGVSKTFVPAIPGIEIAENYSDVSLDPDDFADQRVLIIGKGNSAFETAENLIERAARIHLVSPNPVEFAWKTHFVGHLRAVNNNILDTYLLKSQNAILDATVERIKRRKNKYIVSVNYSHANNEREDLVYDRVIVCTGFMFDTSIFDESARPDLAISGRFPKQTSEWESTNVKDLYFIGTLMQVRDYKKKQSAFIHGFRYNIRTLFSLLEQKYYGKPLVYHRIKCTPESLTQTVIKRVNTTSALWQQFGFLSDLIVLPKGDKMARYYEHLPVDYVQDSKLGGDNDYYLVTLEYGSEAAFEDPFRMNRVARDEEKRAELSNFLHPIIRHYSHSRFHCEHHIIEDLAAEWREDVHVKPLLHFFSSHSHL